MDVITQFINNNKIVLNNMFDLLVPTIIVWFGIRNNRRKDEN